MRLKAEQFVLNNISTCHLSSHYGNQFTERQHFCREPLLCWLLSISCLPPPQSQPPLFSAPCCDQGWSPYCMAQAPFPLAPAGLGQQSASEDQRVGVQSSPAPPCVSITSPSRGHRLPGLRLPLGHLSLAPTTSCNTASLLCPLSPWGSACLPLWLVSGCISSSCLLIEP